MDLLEWKVSILKFAQIMQKPVTWHTFGASSLIQEKKKILWRVMLLPKVSQDQDSISQIGLGGCNSIIQSLIHFALSLEVDWVNRWQVERYDVMGDLYQQLNFHRKASFFKRVAAMHCVNPMLPSPAWSECYHLILQAFPGFRMSFDPQHYQTPGSCL